MKRLFFFLVMVLLTGMVWASEIDRGARQIRISGRKLPASKLEIVVPVQTPVLDFAAMELQTLLKKGGIANCPIRQAPTQGAVSLILGDNELARKAGLDPAKLASEGFFIKRKGNQIFLLGVDDPRVDPKANRWKMWFKRGTLNAVYDFLERFAGVRCYFPGENGTVVPPCKILMLPEVREESVKSRIRKGVTVVGSKLVSEPGVSVLAKDVDALTGKDLSGWISVGVGPVESEYNTLIRDGNKDVRLTACRWKGEDVIRIFIAPEIKHRLFGSGFVLRGYSIEDDGDKRYLRMYGDDGFFVRMLIADYIAPVSEEGFEEPVEYLKDKMITG